MPTAAAPRSGGIDPIDVRLTSLLQAETDAELALAIEQVLGGDVHDVARDVVRRELSSSPAGAAYMEDVLADVRLRLMRKVTRLRPAAGATESDEAPIENLLAYVSVVAENACYAFLRAQYPERTRFRNRVRYAVSHHASTLLVRDAAGIWRCQMRAGVRRIPDQGATQQFLDDASGWLARQHIDISRPLPDLLDVLLARLDHPVELDRLVDALAPIFGVADVQRPTARDDGAPLPEVVDPSPAVSDVMEQREALLSVWEEIVQLPPRQRLALLLNLRDPEGGAVLHMLPGTGVVSMAGIAETLGLDGLALDVLWDKLPLDDLSIAAQLGLSRQQVINLRKSARARLARRLRSS